MGEFGSTRDIGMTALVLRADWEETEAWRESSTWGGGNTGLFRTPTETSGRPESWKCAPMASPTKSASRRQPGPGQPPTRRPSASCAGYWDSLRGLDPGLGTRGSWGDPFRVASNGSLNR